MSDLKQVEVTIAETKKMITLAKTLEKLSTNKDFIAVMHEAYFKDEACRLVYLKADSQMAAPEHQLAIDRAIDAIGHTREFFRTIGQLGSMAEKSLEDHENTRDELQAEELN